MTVEEIANQVQVMHLTIHKLRMDLEVVKSRLNRAVGPPVVDLNEKKDDKGNIYWFEN